MTTAQIFSAAYALAEQMRKTAGDGEFNVGERRNYTSAATCDAGVADATASLLRMAAAMIALLEEWEPNEGADTGPTTVGDISHTALSGWRNKFAEPPDEEWGSWIPWEGGACPVKPDTTIMFKKRSGAEGLSLGPQQFSWEHSGKGNARHVPSADITAYRLRKKSPPPLTPPLYGPPVGEKETTI